MTRGRNKGNTNIGQVYVQPVVLICFVRLASMQTGPNRAEVLKKIEHMRDRPAIKLPTLRGKILDTNGKTIAIDKADFFVYVSYKLTRLLDQRWQELAFLQQIRRGRTKEETLELAKQWTDKEIVPEIKIDAEATFSQLNLETVKQMETLAPFGAGNPRPILFCRDVELDEPARKMGGGDRHLTVKLRQGSKTIRGVAFSAGEWCDEINAAAGPIEIAFRPVINEFRGFRKVEIHLVDWRPSKKMAPVS